jgi:hypothetical protein
VILNGKSNDVSLTRDQAIELISKSLERLLMFPLISRPGVYGCRAFSNMSMSEHNAYDVRQNAKVTQQRCDGPAQVVPMPACCAGNGVQAFSHPVPITQ